MKEVINLEQENKIIEVCFDDRYEKTVHGITQWDKGTKLVISGLALKEDTQVHFCLEENEGDASKVMGAWSGNTLTVEVPAFILEGEETCCYPYEGSYHAYAWVYVTGENYAESVRKINMHIRKRPKPEDYIYTPAEKKTWEELKKLIEDIKQNGGGIANETDPTVPAWAKAATKPTYTASEVGAMVNIPVSVSDDGKFLRVVNGAWAATTINNAEEGSF
jgi:hypothetical protein